MNSDLFWALLGLGSVAVAAVAGMNAWQSRRARKELEQQPQVDATADARHEPTLAAPSTVAPAVDRQATMAVAPDKSRPASRAAALQDAVLDEATDGMAWFDLPEPMGGDRLYQATQNWRRVGGKPVLFEGLAADAVVAEGQSEPWQPLVPRGLWKKVRAGVLLANRNGPLNAVEWTEFSQGMQGVGDAWHTEPRISDGPTILEQARQLDRYCAELDAQLGLNVRVSQPLSANAVATVASLLGLAERGNNRFAALDEHGQLMFSVALGDAALQIALLLDVPRAPHAARPYERMMQTALEMASRLDGEVVDDDGQPLDAQALQAVGDQLQERYATLAASGMPAGSPRALRLFN